MSHVITLLLAVIPRITSNPTNIPKQADNMFFHPGSTIIFIAISSFYILFRDGIISIGYLLCSFYNIVIGHSKCTGSGRLKMYHPVFIFYRLQLFSSGYPRPIKLELPIEPICCIINLNLNIIFIPKIITTKA